MSEETTGKIVRYTFDPNSPAELGLDERQRLESMSDQEIDLTDIRSQAGRPGWRPGLYGAGVAEARRAALREGLLLLDQDVVKLFRENGDTSPQKMNAVLREYAQMHKKTA